MSAPWPIHTRTCEKSAGMTSPSAPSPSQAMSRVRNHALNSLGALGTGGGVVSSAQSCHTVVHALWLPARSNAQTSMRSREPASIPPNEYVVPETPRAGRSEEHTSELQSRENLV